MAASISELSIHPKPRRMRFIVEAHAYAEPCRTCGTETLLFDGTATYDLEGFPFRHSCPVDVRPPGEGDPLWGAVARLLAPKAAAIAHLSIRSVAKSTIPPRRLHRGVSL